VRPEWVKRNAYTLGTFLIEGTGGQRDRLTTPLEDAADRDERMEVTQHRLNDKKDAMRFHHNLRITKVTARAFRAMQQ
jgi:hypothetical protein